MSNEGSPSPLFILQLRGKRPLCFALASSTWRRGLCPPDSGGLGAQLDSWIPCPELWEEVLAVQAWPQGNSTAGGWNGLSGGLTLPLLPLPPQAPLAAESHPGVLPAGEPAQHGQRVYSDLGDL